MLYWMLQHFGALHLRIESAAAGDSRVFLTARIGAAALTAFLLALLAGPTAIRWLQRRFRERISSASATLNELHAGKKGTPTMGGLFVMGSVAASTVLWADLTNSCIQIGLLVTVAMTALGAADDWIKQTTTRHGLSAQQKLAVQFLIASPAAIWLYFEYQSLPHGTDLVWPVGGFAVPLSLGFIGWAAFVMVGTSNAVNLTDGLDGLAAGCTILTGAAFVGLTYLCGHSRLSAYLEIPHIVGAGEAAILVAALVGAMLGFLWFNCHPAQVFLGDAGSLPIGGILAISALVCRQEILLAVIGGVFVIETLSVIIQVGCYRMTGKRVIRCSPLHNHFVFRGDHEIKIVTRFWIVSALLAIAGLASLKIR
ncbi:MAG: phospho-N-acetylmuramoyl-pentapeptide-transferase [Planctomycetaceae bacterium]|nr:phospho-N-acetylmuramoyl-pentapeptide-transferase [Planctomycetaceae bacterium]